jgi:hypothetical protein
MSDALDVSLWRRMRYTPVRDAVRGRITGRLDLEMRLAKSGLPVAARELIARVVRRTRLWRIERADVAAELIAHFADGLDEGETAEAMVARFGDERAAAKLIRRAKRRNRSLAWHAMVFLRRAVIALIVAYGLLALYYFSGRATPKVDYIAEWNANLAKVPQDQRAWPMYRDAIVAMRLEAYVTPDHPYMVDRLMGRPGDPEWPEIARWLSDHAPSLEILRQAAQKPSFGFALGVGKAGEDPALLPVEWRNLQDRTPPSDSPLLDLRAGHLVSLLAAARAVKADVMLARRQGDGPRALRDIATLNRMAEQVRDQDLLWSIDFFIVQFRDDALDAAFDIVSAKDGPLPSDSELAQLAHLFAGLNTASDIVSLTGARRLLDDRAQRMYTDNGAGDGRLTAAGTRMAAGWFGERFLSHRLRHSSFYFPDPQAAIRRFLTAAGPAIPLITISRKEFTDDAGRMMDLAESNFSRPMRNANWDAWWREIHAWKATRGDEMKYAPLLEHLPAAESTHARVERLLGRRDALLVVIALELFRREHGQYPQTLDEMAPALMPSVPADRVTGEPLRYRLVKGVPTVYSVGLDRDDDGGRPPVTERGQLAPTRAAFWEEPPNLHPDGDWVLYPEVKRERRE